MELTLKAESKPLPCGCSPKGTGQPNDPITVNLCQIHKQTQHIIKTLTNAASELAKGEDRYCIIYEISETLNDLKTEHSYSPKFVLKIRSETGIYNIIAYGTQRNDGKWIFKDTNSKTHRFNSVDEVLSFFTGTGTQTKQDIYVSSITNEDMKDIQTLYSMNDISLIEPINIDTLSYENQ